MLHRSVDAAAQQRTRVAIVLPNLRGGGAERVAIRLAEDMASRGCEVDLVLLQAVGELISLPARHIHVVDLGCRRIAAALGPLARYFRSRKPDTILVSMWPLTVIATLAWRLAGSRARLVVSDHTLLSRQYGGHNRFVRAALRLSTRLIYPMATARVAVSEAVARDLALLSNLPEGRFDVINNPVAGPPAGRNGIEAAEALWGGAAHRILTVGDMKPEKQQALLLRSFARLLPRRDARLVLVGDGPLRPRLERLAEELGIADRVAFAGFTLDVWPFYKTASLFALSSDVEGFPLVVCEALHCGLPVVSTRAGGVPEILGEGRYGHLVPEGDAEAFAEALDRALDGRFDAALLRQRAERVAGQSCSDRYSEIMIPHPPIPLAQPAAMAADPA
jgi:glycosyltransferase involved in cell wall biosynthesis